MSLEMIEVVPHPPRSRVARNHCQLLLDFHSLAYENDTSLLSSHKETPFHLDV